MPGKTRQQKIDDFTDADLVSNWTRIFKLGVKGILRFCDLLEVLTIGLPDGEQPVDNFHWEELNEDDQVFMDDILYDIKPYFDAYQQLPPSRQQGIMAQVRTNIYGIRR